MELRRVESALFETLLRTVGTTLTVLNTQSNWSFTVKGVLYKPADFADAAETSGAIHFRLILRKSDISPQLLTGNLDPYLFIENATGRQFTPVATDGRYFSVAGNSGVLTSMVLSLNHEPAY